MPVNVSRTSEESGDFIADREADLLPDVGGRRKTPRF